MTHTVFLPLCVNHTLLLNEHVLSNRHFYMYLHEKNVEKNSILVLVLYTISLLEGWNEPEQLVPTMSGPLTIFSKRISKSKRFYIYCGNEKQVMGLYRPLQQITDFTLDFRTIDFSFFNPFWRHYILSVHKMDVTYTKLNPRGCFHVYLKLKMIDDIFLLMIVYHKFWQTFLKKK